MIDVQDLLGQSHEPRRCIGYVHEVLRRKFDDFEPREIPDTAEAARAWLENPPISRWHEIGLSAFAAKKDGDVVYGESELDGAYVAILIDEAKGTFLTSTGARGCHLRAREKLTGIVSAQRRTP